MGRKGGRYIIDKAGKRELRDPPTRNSPGAVVHPAPGEQGGGGVSSHAAAPDTDTDGDTGRDAGPGAATEKKARTRSPLPRKDN